MRTESIRRGTVGDERARKRSRLTSGYNVITDERVAKRRDGKKEMKRG